MGSHGGDLGSALFAMQNGRKAAGASLESSELQLATTRSLSEGSGTARSSSADVGPQAMLEVHMKGISPGTHRYWANLTGIVYEDVSCCERWESSGADGRGYLHAGEVVRKISEVIMPRLGIGM